MMQGKTNGSGQGTVRGWGLQYNWSVLCGGRVGGGGMQYEICGGGGVVAPAPRASTEKACARAAHRPTGESSFQFSLVIWGALRMPVILGEGREREWEVGGVVQ